MNWPVRSPVLSHVWGHMKSMNTGFTRDELMAARYVTKAAILRKVTQSVVKRTGCTSRLTGNFFEQLL